jgi:carbon monoxide dehydrogenase subunit G
LNSLAAKRALGNSTIGAAFHGRSSRALQNARVLLLRRDIQTNTSDRAQGFPVELCTKWRRGDKSSFVGNPANGPRRLDLCGAMRKTASRSRAALDCAGVGVTADGSRKETSMAMTMTGDVTLPAHRPKVWALLNDPEVLKACIPGCESLEKTGDNGFAAVVKTKIGPVSTTFRGKVELSDLAPLVGYTIKGDGEGGIAGFAKGGAKVSLADAPGGTLLHYDVEAHVGGKIAQLGARLIDGVAKNMADKFFANFAAIAAASAAPAGAAESAAPSMAAAASVVESPAPARATPPAPPPAPARPAPQAIPTKTSWFRRIWEWLMSLWR